MKKISRYIFIIIMFVIISNLAACGYIDNSVNDGIEVVYLDAPIEIIISQENKTIAWNKVDNASGYKVRINDAEYDADDTVFSLEKIEDEGIYNIQVKSKGYVCDNIFYIESEFCSNVTYVVEKPLDFFDIYRKDRFESREKTLEFLDSIINNSESSEFSIEQACQKRVELCQAMERELVLEALIKTCGYEDCVVTISSSKVNIIVKASELTESEAAKILNIVTTELNVEAFNVRIIPIE